MVTETHHIHQSTPTHSQSFYNGHAYIKIILGFSEFRHRQAEEPVVPLCCASQVIQRRVRSSHTLVPMVFMKGYAMACRW